MTLVRALLRRGLSSLPIVHDVRPGFELDWLASSMVATTRKGFEATFHQIVDASDEKALWFRVITTQPLQGLSELEQLPECRTALKSEATRIIELRSRLAANCEIPSGAASEIAEAVSRAIESTLNILLGMPHPGDSLSFAWKIPVSYGANKFMDPDLQAISINVLHTGTDGSSW